MIGLVPEAIRAEIITLSLKTNKPTLVSSLIYDLYSIQVNVMRFVR